MCQPRKWWWGLLPLAALWAGSVFVLTPQIEEELAHRVVTAVRKDMPWAKTLIEGRDIYIEGAAPSEEARHNVVNAVLETDGVRLAINTAGLIPEAKPFTWSASRDATKLTLSGYVAPDGSREKIAAEARKLVPNAAIVDDMKEARGAPAGAVAMTAAALAALARLRAGKLQKPVDRHVRPGDPEWDGLRTAQNAFQAEDPLQGELVIERERWAFIESLAVNRFFDMEYLVAYALFLQVLERKARFAAEKGQEGYRTVYSSVLESADYRDESGEKA